MWGTLFKLVALKFFGHRLHRFISHLMAFIEQRGHILSRSLGDEWNRLVKTLFGMVVVLSALAFSALIGAAWIVALAWNSPSRDVILAVAMVMPMFVVLLTALYLRGLWHNRPYLQQSRVQLNEDWQILRGALDGDVREAQSNQARKDVPPTQNNAGVNHE